MTVIYITLYNKQFYNPIFVNDKFMNKIIEIFVLNFTGTDTSLRL